MLNINYIAFLHRASSNLWVLLIGNFRRHLSPVSCKFFMESNESCFCTSKVPSLLAWRMIGESQSPYLLCQTCVLGLSGWKFGVFFWSPYIWHDFLRQLNHEAHPGGCLWFPCYYDVSCWSCHLSGMDPVIKLSRDENYWKRENISMFSSARYFFSVVFSGRNNMRTSIIWNKP